MTLTAFVVAPTQQIPAARLDSVLKYRPAPTALRAKYAQNFRESHSCSVAAGVLSVSGVAAGVCVPARGKRGLAKRNKNVVISCASNKFEDFEPPPPKDGDYQDIFCRGVNGAFKQLVIPVIQEKVAPQPAGTAGKDLLDKLTAAPEVPGISRPLWAVIAGSVPTALGWYGYYKFSVEEEMFQEELREKGRVTGCGGYGTLFPFVFGFLFGVAAQLAGFEQLGTALISVASVWILAGQINLYKRVNEICVEQKGVSDGKPVVWEWWALLPPPIDVIVGVRQVHYLAKAQAAKRGETWEKDVVAEEWFPFVDAPRFTLQEFFLTPSMWFSFTKDVPDIELPFLRESSRDDK